MKQFLKITFILILLNLGSQAFAVDENQLKKLAHELVNDIEGRYGAQVEINGVEFKVAEYRRLIDRTQFKEGELNQKGELVNYREVRLKNGEVKVLAQIVDAINFFPKQDLIEYNKIKFERLIAEKKITEIKKLLHHEFVPYFIGRSDDSFEFNRKIDDIYEKKVTWRDLKEGLYEVAHFEDPMLQNLSTGIWIYLAVNKLKSSMTVTIVQKPDSDVWCLTCFSSTVETIKVDLDSDYLLVDKVFKNIALPEGFGADNKVSGSPYYRILPNNTIVAGWIEIVDPNKRNAFEDSQNLDRRGLLLRRVDLKKAGEWKSEKSILIDGLSIRNDPTECKEAEAEIRSFVVRQCANFAMGTILFDYKSCLSTPVKVVDIKNSSELHKDRACVYYGIIKIPNRPDRDPYFAQMFPRKIKLWNFLLAVHERVDQGETRNFFDNLFDSWMIKN